MKDQTIFYNPLTRIGNQQWIKLVELLTENVLALNSRVLSKVEILYNSDGHYPVAYFRLTTALAKASNGDPQTEVSGFVFGFNNDWDDDVYIHALTPLGYQESWLKENGITSFFTYHEVGLRKLHTFLEKELKIWSITENTVANDSLPNDWRELTF